ncbi:uncharacterized protein EV420DRAFT_1605078 [Desarmillaria tabescens]|uniref:Uncharacterized protein n=1 Tax=Armillaria tabescens TaxID=1929756 RepID=A0AA39IZ89_ARMTA|nr:uncharacterized protein EV420DRAFT_1605078 [Desarmillaria tabescens]KAK0432539.1 hypothetical protein EV420DRAFT_1605078 [Desarmillaria tabescens]
MQFFYNHMSPEDVQGFINRVTQKHETRNTPGFDSSVERSPSRMASPMRSGSVDCHAAGLDEDRIPYGKKGKWAVNVEDIEDDDDIEWRKAQMAADEQLAKEIETAQREAALKHKEAEARLARHIEDARRARSKASSTSLVVQSSRASNQLPHDGFSGTRTSHTPSSSQIPVGMGYDSDVTISEPSSVYSSDSDSTKRRKREKKKRYKKQRAHRKRELGNEKVVLPEKYDGSPKFDVFQRWLYSVTDYFKTVYIEKMRRVPKLQHFLSGKAAAFFMREVAIMAVQFVIGSLNYRIWLIVEQMTIFERNGQRLDIVLRFQCLKILRRLQFATGWRAWTYHESSFQTFPFTA